MITFEEFKKEYDIVFEKLNCHEIIADFEEMGYHFVRHKGDCNMQTHAEMITEWRSDSEYQEEYATLEDEFSQFEIKLRQKAIAKLEEKTAVDLQSMTSDHLIRILCEI
jgi:GTPase involved in cell partitioning and DNA repair